MFSHFACDKAFYRIVPRGASTVDSTAVFSVLRDHQRVLYLVGSVLCPRGCGTVIHWLLSSDVADHKEEFLVYLNQQLWWTDCPDHVAIRPQKTPFSPAKDWTFLPPSSSVMAAGPRYRNLYE